MPTINITIPAVGWTQVAAAGVAGFVAQAGGSGYLEWATTTGGTPPTAGVSGHVLPADVMVGRSTMGPGAVWVRQYPSGHDSITMAVTA